MTKQINDICEAEEMISALIEFVSKNYSASEWAKLGVLGMPSTKVGMLNRFYKEKIKKYPRYGTGGGFVFSFFDLPSSYQRDILNYFVSKYQRPKEAMHLTSKEYDAVLFACASRDLKFAEYWRRHEIKRAEIHKKILRLLEL